MKHRVIGATEFKAKCLALLEEIGEHGGSLTACKRGKPLATVGQTGPSLPRRACMRCC